MIRVSTPGGDKQGDDKAGNQEGIHYLNESTRGKELACGWYVSGYLDKHSAALFDVLAVVEGVTTSQLLKQKIKERITEILPTLTPATRKRVEIILAEMAAKQEKKEKIPPKKQRRNHMIDILKDELKANESRQGDKEVIK